MKAKTDKFEIVKRLIAFSLCCVFLLFISQYLFGQPAPITINKTVVAKANACNQFDATLSITGNPPDRPIEVILVIDRSGIMDGSPLTYAKQAATNFTSQVFKAANNPLGLNKVGIVSYGSTATLDRVLTLAGDSNLVKAAISGISVDNSNQYPTGFHPCRQ
jgi:hypothetical protein